MTDCEQKRRQDNHRRKLEHELEIAMNITRVHVRQLESSIQRVRDIQAQLEEGAEDDA